MAESSSFIMYFWQAGFVVKCVLLLLVAASVMSWTYIFKKNQTLKKIRAATECFEDEVWRSHDLNQLFRKVQDSGRSHIGLERIFCAGFQTFNRLRAQGADEKTIIAATDRAMRSAQSKVGEALETHLPFLATVGSISPYVGLFGTVWGMMTALHHISGMQQVTISMVAPGIAEALIATAMGLFAAIPAVVAYNRFASCVDGLLNRFLNFQDEITIAFTRALTFKD